MKRFLRDVLLSVLVFALTFGMTTASVQVYAEFNEEQESLKAMHDIELTFDEEAFAQAVTADTTVDPKTLLTNTDSQLLSVETDVESVDLSKVGETTVAYTVKFEDKFENVVTKTAEKTFAVTDQEVPVISFKKDSVSFTEGEKFDPKKNIESIVDNVDGDILDNEELVTVDSDVADKPGNYTVTVTAVDAAGNKASTSYGVEVKAKPVVVQQTVSRSYAGGRSYSGGVSYSGGGNASVSSGGGSVATYSAPAVNYGSAGRIYLSNGYSAAAYAGSLWDAGYTQSLINNGDSAFVDYSFNYIADHAAQGFWFDYGTTLTWTYADGSSRTYTCTRVLTGPKGSWDCYEGFDVLDGAGGQLITQTCAGDGLRWGYWN